MPLTPEQFNKLVTKDYLEEKLENLATKEDANKILTAVDGIVHKHQSFEVEMAANLGAHDRLNKKIDGHEIRLKKLESPV